MKKLKKLLLTSIGACAFACAFTASTIDVDAKTQNMNWLQRGEKSVGNSYIYTQFDGTVSAKKGSAFLWWGDDDSVTWKGNSRSAWLGTNPSYDADSITHTDTIWIEGSGKPSYSASIGADPSVGISSASAGEKNSYSYSVTNDWKIDVDYSYSGNIWSWSYVGQKSSAVFKFGSSYKVVDSEANNTIDYRSNCWFS